MSAPEVAFGAGLRTALAGSQAVRAVLGDPPRLFAEAPPDPIFPYAVFGEERCEARDAAEAPAFEHGLSVHVFVRHGGREQAQAAVAAVRAALHDQPLTIEGRRAVFVYVPYADVFRTANPAVLHAVIRVKALSEPV